MNEREKRTNLWEPKIWIIGIPEREEKGNIKDIINERNTSKKLPKFEGHTFPVWKVLTVTTKIDENRPNPGHIISWFQNSEKKEKILEASREDKK